VQILKFGERNEGQLRLVLIDFMGKRVLRWADRKILD
jgi:hypothetical protein